MTERDAILRMKTELVGTDKAADGVAELADSFKKVDGAADQAAGALNDAAAATSGIEDTQRRAGEEIKETTEALRREGEATRESARAGASAAAGATTAARAASGAAEGLAAAQRDAGAAAAQGGQQAESAAKNTGSAIDRLIASFREQIAAAREAGEAFTPEQAVAKLTELLDGVRATSTSLQEQRTALIGIGDDITKEFAEVSAAAKVSGADISRETKITEGAMAAVRAKVAEVEAEIASLGSSAPPKFAEIERASISFADAATIGIRRVNEAYEQYGDTLRITPGTLKVVAESAEAVGIALQQAAERGQAATVEQIALYERLQGEVRELTAISNRLTNAGKDATIGLQETGNRVAGLANSVQQLTSALGPNAARVGLLVGNVGQLGGVYEDLKSKLGAVNFAQLGLAQSGKLAAGGIGAVLATAVLAVAAGLKLASANREVGKTFEETVDKAKKLLVTQEQLADNWDGLQHATQEVIASVLQYTQLSEDWQLTTASAAEKQTDLSRAIDLVRLAATGGRQDMDAYAIALRDGLSQQEAFNLATAHGEEVMKFYAEAKQAGRQGSLLWAQAMKESQGTADGLFSRLQSLRPELDKVRGAHGLLTGELQKEYNARQQLAAALERDRQLRAAEAEQLRSASAATQENVQRMLEERAVVNGSTVAINDRLQAIREHIIESDLWSVSIARNAETAQQLLDAQDGLTRVERARIQSLIDLAARANELTEAEQLHAARLIDAIVTGQNFTATLNDQSAATQALTTATAANSDADAVAAQVMDERTAAIHRQLAAIREQIAQMEAQGQGAQKLAAINLDAGVSIDYLKQKEAALVRELESNLTVWSAASEATSAQADERAALAAVIEREKAAQDGLRTSTAAIVPVNDAARISFTNLAEGADGLVTATIKQTEAWREGGTEASRAADVLRDLQTTTAILPGDVLKLAEALPQVNEHIRAMRDLARESAAEVNALADGVNKLNAASAAAGGQ